MPCHLQKGSKQILHELPQVPCEVEDGYGSPQGDLIPSYSCWIMQLTPGDPCLWGSLQSKLKTEHIVAGQKVLENPLPAH